MIPNGDQLPWGLRIFRAVIIAFSLVALAGLVFCGYLAITGDASQTHAKRTDLAGAMFGFSFVMFIVLLHGYIVLRARRLTSHSISDVVVPILLIPLMLFFLGNMAGVIAAIYSKLQYGYFGSGISILFGAMCILLAAILIIGLRMKPLLAFSIPSNWISVIPLVLTYVMFMNPYIWLAGMIFPTHRRMKEYWRPKPLPRIKHRPIKEAKL